MAAEKVSLAELANEVELVVKQHHARDLFTRRIHEFCESYLAWKTAYLAWCARRIEHQKLVSRTAELHYAVYEPPKPEWVWESFYFNVDDCLKSNSLDFGWFPPDLIQGQEPDFFSPLKREGAEYRRRRNQRPFPPLKIAEKYAMLAAIHDVHGHTFDPSNPYTSEHPGKRETLDEFLEDFAFRELLQGLNEQSPINVQHWHTILQNDVVPDVIQEIERAKREKSEAKADREPLVCWPTPERLLEFADAAESLGKVIFQNVLTTSPESPARLPGFIENLSAVQDAIKRLDGAVFERHPRFSQMIQGVDIQQIIHCWQVGWPYFVSNKAQSLWNVCLRLITHFGFPVKSLTHWIKVNNHWEPETAGNHDAPGMLTLADNSNGKLEPLTGVLPIEWIKSLHHFAGTLRDAVKAENARGSSRDDRERESEAKAATQTETPAAVQVEPVANVLSSEPFPPKVYLTSWREILFALESKNNPENRTKVRSLSKQFKGPIILPARGGQPKVEKRNLLEWWDALESEFCESKNKAESKLASVSEQHNYGKSGMVAPEIRGSIKRSRKRQT